MASTRYRTKTNNAKNSIFLRFKQGKQFDTEASTGIKVPKGKFSLSLQKINTTDLVDYELLNKKLRDLKVFIDNQYSKDFIEGVEINNKWLKENIRVFLKKKSNIISIDSKLFFLPFLEEFIETAKKRIDSPNRPITKKTTQHYQTAKNKIKAFEKHKGITLKLTDINLNFHYNFIEYLEIEEKLNPNTIGGYIDTIKIACRKADIKGLDVCLDFKSSDFYTPTNKTNDPYLSIDEINEVYNHKFKLDYLNNARDWLIIGVWTGLRVSDLLTLNKSNLDGDFIKKDTQKTDFPVIIPKHKHVKAILKKRKGEFPRKISDQNFNRYIKIVCKEVGFTKKIKGSKKIGIETLKGEVKKIIFRKKVDMYPKYELISSHICRRSFASNLFGKLDTHTIMKITGHRTEKEFLGYIKITQKTYAEKLKSYWDKVSYDEILNS